MKVINSYLKEAYEVMENSKYNELREKKGRLRANYLLLRQFGKSLPKVKKLTEKYGLKFACICGNPLEIGISKLLGMKVYKANEGNSAKIIKERMNLLKKALKENNFVIVHIKGPDEFGHDGDFNGKKEFIERIDRELEPILNLDFSRVCLILTGDHSTPVMVREHTADPIPVIILHEGVRVDEVKQFSEFEAYKGGLCRIRGMDLTNIALDLIDKAKKFGA